MSAAQLEEMQAFVVSLLKACAGAKQDNKELQQGFLDSQKKSGRDKKVLKKHYRECVNGLVDTDKVQINDDSSIELIVIVQKKEKEEKKVKKEKKDKKEKKGKVEEVEVVEEVEEPVKEEKKEKKEKKSKK